MIAKQQMEAAAQVGMEKIFKTVPRSREFHDGSWIEEPYYRRHLIETAKRIPMMNTSDAYALYRCSAKDAALAAKFAHYLSEELGHEAMFESDIRKFGVTEQEFERIAPFVATDKLIGVLHSAIERDGLIGPAAWNWFVEWYSDRFNPVITAKAAATFGPEMVKGSNAHIGFDGDHEHNDLMFEIVCRANQFGSAEIVTLYLERFTALVGEYFDELYRMTSGDASLGCREVVEVRP